MEAADPMTTPDPDVLADELAALLSKVSRGGPHEWGYRDPVEGGFIVDDWPFEAAVGLEQAITALRAQPDPAMVEALNLEWLSTMAYGVVAQYAFNDGCREGTCRDLVTGHYTGIKLKAEMVVDMVADLQETTRAALSRPSPATTGDALAALLDDYDRERSEQYRLAGHRTGHGVGKVASHREQLEQAARVAAARERILAILAPSSAEQDRSTSKGEGA